MKFKDVLEGRNLISSGDFQEISVKNQAEGEKLAKKIKKDLGLVANPMGSYGGKNNHNYFVRVFVQMNDKEKFKNWNKKNKI
jgi:hypothetical protein